MSREDVPVLPPNYFPNIPFISFLARRLQPRPRPVQSTLKEFSLSQSISMDISIIPRYQFVLTQNISLLIERPNVMERTLHQDIQLQIVTGEVDLLFILEQSANIQHDTGLTFLLEFILEQSANTQHDTGIVPTLTFMLEQTAFLITALKHETMMLEAGLIATADGGTSIRITFTLDGGIEASAAGSGGLNAFTLDRPELEASAAGGTGINAFVYNDAELEASASRVT